MSNRCAQSSGDRGWMIASAWRQRASHAGSLHSQRSCRHPVSRAAAKAPLQTRRCPSSLGSHALQVAELMYKTRPEGGNLQWSRCLRIRPAPARPAREPLLSMSATPDPRSRRPRRRARRLPPPRRPRGASAPPCAGGAPRPRRPKGPPRALGRPAKKTPCAPPPGGRPLAQSCPRSVGQPIRPGRAIPMIASRRRCSTSPAEDRSSPPNSADGLEEDRCRM
mmetsp:Transcript_153797/g.493163  ORF Transcript_153797/g.493163 Transcript_153797/m.493163 type:complete len:222 (-) Transcript_153797:764-1429(-)